MALSLKLDTEDVPAIFKMLGLGGDSSQADPGQAPPIDSYLAGAPDSPDAGSSKQSVPTKLGRLQQIIQSSQGNTDSPGMTDQHNSPVMQNPPPVDPSVQGAPDPNAIQGSTESPLPPMAMNAPTPQPRSLEDILSSPTATGSIASRDMSNLPNVGQGNPPQVEVQSWAEQHPVLAKMLKMGIGAAQGAATGAGSMTFGEGYQKAAELPLDIASKKLGLQHTAATIEQMKSQVTLPNGLTVPFALAQRLYPQYMKDIAAGKRNSDNIDSREGIAADNINSKEGIAAAKNVMALRAKGLKPNPTNPDGPPVALSRDEMSENEQATLDLKQSQSDAADARADLDRQKNDPNSAAYKAAMGRLQVANKNAQTAAGRLGLAKDTFNANYFGTGPDGQALPGVPLTDNDTPIGVRVANITKPTNATRSKAEQATVIKQQGEDILKQIDANPDIYGAVAGRWNEFNAGKFGNASQDVRDAYTSLKSFAALQPALHGARGVGMMKEFEDAVGNMGNDPDGLKGSINSLLRTSNAFQKAGTMKTAPGGGNHPAATHVYDPSTGVISPVK